MKTKHAYAVTSAIVVLVIFSSTTLFARSKEKQKINEKTVELKITDMTCAGCSSQLGKVLTETTGVIDNSVQYPGDIAEIKYDADKVSLKQLVETIHDKTSYTAEVVEKNKKKS